MKHFFKSKKGMTYVELLVAFTLLVLVIMVFSPMLLNSYNTLYSAGEKNVNTYSAKSKVEDELAYRSSNDIIYNLQANFHNIGEMSKVNVRRITESLTNTYSDMITTIFYNGKGYIRLLSSARTNDDANSKTFVFQTSGFVIDDVLYNGEPSKTTNDGGKSYRYKISLAIYVPDKTQASQENAYKKVYGSENISIDTSALNDSGVIRLTVKGVDLTNSPLKMVLSYYDENASVPNDKDEIREINTFLYIDPPTIMLGGDSVNDSGKPLEYFTSEGLSKDSAGNMSLDIDGRDMTGLSYATGTSIKNISWINNDTVSTGKGYNPYYVLTGTNGTIVRLHSSSNESAYNEMISRGVINKEEVPLPITDKGIKRTVYPVAWGGDTTEQFGFSTWQQSMGYRWPSVQHSGSSCWYTQEGTSNKTSSAYTKFSSNAKYAFVYNGYKTDYKYSQQNGRKISYCLTETVASLRFVGCQENEFTGYNSTWENNTKWLGTTIFESKDDVHQTKSVTFRVKTGDSGALSDANFGYINMKAFNSLAPSYLFDTVKYSNASASNWSSKVDRYIDTASEAVTSLTITDAVFDEGMGGMYYVGNANGYAFIRQNDLTSTGEAERVTMHDAVSSGFLSWYSKNIPSGTVTAYYIAGNGGNGTTVKKQSSNGSDIGPLQSTMQSNSGQTSSVPGDRNSFFSTRSTNLTQAFFDDFKFTFGYASNRFKTYSDVTVIGNQEQYRSYEKYYFLSHYGDAAHEPAWFAYNSTYVSSVGYDASVKNTYNDDYYNIWFPGEFYNLSKVVSKEGVTVGVGYSVSGSVYQWVNPNKTANSSTAIGGLFNDGILAVKTIQDEYFYNKLYFKDNATFDGSSLSNVTEYKSVFGTYGTHSRKSIQFTAVDLLVEGGVDTGEEVAEGGSETKTYTAYYGDNTGRVFKSLVASSVSTGVESGSSIQVVGFVADTTYAGTATPPSRMEEILLPGDKSVSTVFDKITNIVADGSTVIISGTTKAAGAYVVIGQKSDSGTWAWRAVKITNKSYIINDAAVCEGVYYACGEVGSNGFYMAVDLGDITAAMNSSTSDISSYVISAEKMRTPSTAIGDDASSTLPKLYSIACRGSGA